jgi:hypothetical protein
MKIVIKKGGNMIKTKIISIVLTCIIMWCVLVGCKTVNENNNTQNKYSTFTLINSVGSIYVYKEDVTDVMYAALRSGYKGGLTVMLDADGTPLLYSEWENRQ